TRALTIVEPGGVLDGLVQRVDGAATWAAGEEVVVFVARERLAGARFRTIGLAQGKLDVLAAGGAKRVVPSIGEGLHLVDPTTKTAVAARLRVVSLDELRRDVLAASRRSR
ncbi:hypothetical protein L6R52_42195, partial [Myxococcota bacterium]|nr:hypothetical protein [Myxococcota bacterium]